MVQRKALLAFIDQLLEVEKFDDYCVNGLQVEGKEGVERIVLGVSSSARLFQRAIQERADLILVHHGLFWRNSPHPFALRGLYRSRVAPLIQHDINLAAYHLPLDAHPELGNNAQLIRRLGLSREEPIEVGFLGSYAQPLAWEEFVRRVNRLMETDSLVLPYGEPNVQKIAVISGGSSGYYREVFAAGADTFLSGDVTEYLVREIEESGLNFICPGHYNTEKFGVQALGAVLSEHFGVYTQFIDIPNPV